MKAADRTYLAGFHAALDLAERTGSRILLGRWGNVIRREHAAAGLLQFVDAAREALGTDTQKVEVVETTPMAASGAALKIGDGLDILKLRRPPVTLADASNFGAVPADADLRVQAASFGYTGDMCPDCLNLTMVRNGTCLKCDTCGSTTGCS